MRHGGSRLRRLAVKREHVWSLRAWRHVVLLRLRWGLAVELGLRELSWLLLLLHVYKGAGRLLSWRWLRWLALGGHHQLLRHDLWERHPLRDFAEKLESHQELLLRELPR